jgi:transcriptional accessory protein Tex/SPT6
MMAVTGNQAIGVASAAGSIVAEICNYLFFSRIDKTNRTVADHHQELLQSKRLENLIAAADKLSDLEKRNSMIMRIIETAAAGWLTTALRQDVSERKSLQN